MNRFFLYRSLRRALLSREGLIVLLAFILTLSIYGTIFYSLTSSYRRDSTSISRFSGSITVYFSEGYVWRLYISLPQDLKKSKLSGVAVVVDGVEFTASFLDSEISQEAVSARGSLVTSLASGVANVDGLGPVDLVVFIDPDGKLSVVVDDDFDSYLDDSYLLKFVQGFKRNVELWLDRDAAASVARGSSIPLEHLDLVLAASTSARPIITVYDSGRVYSIPILEILKNLKKVVAYRVTTDSLDGVILVLPLNLCRGGSEVTIKLVGEGVTLETSAKLPTELVGSGRIVVAAR
ncbi:MAG: hypothetical protein RMI56_04425 [Sulfolobales archaeon]|nr:hypothetical protein [Sulfolobales archaeon]MDW8083029.1 hypothetical protein [Sulfolobales archaeon]